MPEAEWMVSKKELELPLPKKIGSVTRPTEHSAQENVRNALSNHRDLVALVGIWAYNAPAIARTVESAGVKKDMTVVTFDAQEAAIQEMEKGNIDAMLVQNPFDMDFQAVRLLSAMVLENAAVEKEMFPNSGADADIYTTGLRLVVPNNGSPLKAEGLRSESS